MEFEPIDVVVPASPDDPRDPPPDPPGVRIHRVPALHPDDVTVHNGIPITTVERTLIDLAEVMEADELRHCFYNAVSRGMVDFYELDAARARVEWRPSLALFDEVAAEFDQHRTKSS